MKRNKNQKTIYTSFNQRVTAAFLEINCSISPKEQVYGDNLFNLNSSELTLLDDLNYPLSTHFDTNEKVNDKGDSFPSIRLSSDFHNFGEVLIDTFEEFYLSIINENKLSVTLKEINGLPANGFTLCQPPAFPATIPPKGSQFLRVLFSPETEGEKTAILSLTIDNHQTYTLQVKLTGIAIKAYFLMVGSLQVRGFGKKAVWANLGRGEVCPCCKIGEVGRVTSHIWMRLIPLAGHFACRKCGARFLTIYKWGKVLF